MPVSEHPRQVGSRALWDAVRTLGRLEPAPDAIERLFDALPPDDLRLAVRLREEIADAQVVELADRSLRVDAASATPLRRVLADLLRADAEEAARRWERVRPLARSLVARAALAGGRLIKGLALRRLYPDPALRHVGDVDLQFDRLDDALDFIQGLRREGWAWDASELPWIKWDDGGEPYGQWGIVYELAAGLEYRIDVHVGPYSVGHLGLLPLRAFEPIELEGEPITAPDPATSAAMIAAHAAGDYYLSMKDVNDVTLVVSAGVDWDRCLALARGAGVEDALGQILCWAAETYGVELPEGVSAKPDEPLPVGSTNDLRRALATTRLAFVQERRCSSALRAALRTPGALAAYTLDLSPRRRRLGHSWPKPSRRRRWLCWRLVPADVCRTLANGDVPVPAKPTREPLAGGLELVRISRGCAVQRDGDVFVPTISGRLTPHSLALARRLADDHAGR